MGPTLSITDFTSFIQHFQKQVIFILLILYIAFITSVGLTYAGPYLHVITFLVSAGPGPALVDAVIEQLY